MKFLFYIEGLGGEVWQEGDTRKAARKALWDGLSDEDQSRVVQIECIDESA